MLQEQLERATAASLNSLNRKLNRIMQNKEETRLDYERKQQEHDLEIERLNQEIDLISFQLKSQIAQKSSLDCKQLQDAIDEYVLSHPEFFSGSLKTKAKQRLYVRKEKRAALQIQEQAVLDKNAETTNPSGQNDPVVNQEGELAHENA